MRKRTSHIIGKDDSMTQALTTKLVRDASALTRQRLSIHKKGQSLCKLHKSSPINRLHYDEQNDIDAEPAKDQKFGASSKQYSMVNSDQKLGRSISGISRTAKIQSQIKQSQSGFDIGHTKAIGSFFSAER